MLDRLTSMAAFVKAADLGSFTAAGMALGMTSQMVGKHVTALEQRLGSPLLRRTTRRQKLTELGRRYHERCRIVLAEAEAADAIVEEESEQPRGPLRVSAPVGFGAASLAPVIADFLVKHPAMKVEVILTDRYVDPVDEGFDAVLRLGPVEKTTWGMRELTSHDQVACAAPVYIARNGTPPTPAHLAAHECLGFVNWSGRLYAEWRFGREGAIQAVTVRPRLQVNDGRALVAAAVAGHGIILQPRAVVADALATGALTPVLTDYVAPSRPMYLLFVAREPQPPKLTAFVEHVAAAFPATLA